LSKLKDDILLGDRVSTSQVIGYSGRDKTSALPGFSLRIEKDGVFINPLEIIKFPETGKANL
jgi:hypothetical protein